SHLATRFHKPHSIHSPDTPPTASSAQAALYRLRVSYGVSSLPLPSKPLLCFTDVNQLAAEPGILQEHIAGPENSRHARILSEALQPPSEIEVPGGQHLELDEIRVEEERIPRRAVLVHHHPCAVEPQERRAEVELVPFVIPL